MLKQFKDSLMHSVGCRTESYMSMTNESLITYNISNFNPWFLISFILLMYGIVGLIISYVEQNRCHFICEYMICI